MRTRSLARARDRKVAKSRKENARVSPSSQPKKNAVHRSIEKGDRGGEVKEKKEKKEKKMKGASAKSASGYTRTREREREPCYRRSHHRRAERIAKTKREQTKGKNIIIRP